MIRSVYLARQKVEIILASIIFYIIILFGCNLASAGVYKWVDKDGRVHYGEQPPGIPAMEIKIPQSDPQNATGREVNERIKDMQDWNDARQLEREKKKQDEQKRLQKKQELERKCAGFRAGLQDLEVGGVSWYDLDDKGDRHYLSDKEMAIRAAELRKTIAEHCN